MNWSNPILYELGLTIVAVVAFAVWQTVDLKRAARELKEKDGAEAEGHRPESARDADR